MRPKRYPYSGKRKKLIGESIDFAIDKKAILMCKIADALEVSIDELG